jgi:unsaturated chondroitin disaccharide hydrolase
MPIKIDNQITSKKLLPKISRLFELSAEKILSLEKSWDPSRGTPVFTIKGRYTSRSWTEWTQGFQFGSMLLQYDATGDKRFLEMGRSRTVQLMATHVSHVGVHDHGFNNVSTYGNLLRLMNEGKIAESAGERQFCELALKVSGAVQAARWTDLADGGGYIYSFNGPHSLFIDTLRSLRSLAVAHKLGHVLMGERDRKISLMGRLVEHAAASARYSVYYGKGRDAYDIRGRTAHESIFNVNDGTYRCPSTQQGYSPFSTWTRGLAWGLLGFAEQLEFFDSLPDHELENASGERGVPRKKNRFLDSMRQAALAEADFYIENSCSDGVPVWDTGAPNLHRLGDYLAKPSDPFNAWEPMDSSAAAIAAQGLIRLANHLRSRGENSQAAIYRQAGLTVADAIFDEPYLSSDRKHQGLVLHSVYHRPNGWDYVAPGQKIPNGQSSAWGDYHARELALLLLREANGEQYLRFA